MDENKSLEAIPQNFHSLEEASDFWDNHDAGDYEQFLRPVETELQVATQLPQTVLLEHSLSQQLKDIARRKGVSLETLVNLWLEDKLLDSHAV